MAEDILKEVEHHKQQELCKTRPAYRQGKQLTAVKVYTVNSESSHLFVYGVPKINLRIELKNLCSKYGQLLSIHVVDDYKTEVFTECFHVQYERIQSARIAKRLLDNRSFYGGILHVCYAPEFESLQETRNKLEQRKRDVLNRLGNESNSAQSNNNSNKRKHVETLEKGGLSGHTPRRKSKVRKTYEIYNEDDPILLSYKKTSAERDKEKTAVYGPQIPFMHHIEVSPAAKEESTSFIPSQVKEPKVIEKRIVFRKKILVCANISDVP